MPAPRSTTVERFLEWWEAELRESEGPAPEVECGDWLTLCCGDEELVLHMVDEDTYLDLEALSQEYGLA